MFWLIEEKAVLKKNNSRYTKIYESRVALFIFVLVSRVLYFMCFSLFVFFFFLQTRPLFRKMPHIYTVTNAYNCWYMLLSLLNFLEKVLTDMNSEYGFKEGGGEAMFG